jgi:uncharacterized coiled-coil DUF342 family protein
MATLAEIRRLLFDDTVPYDWSDDLINDVLAEETNKYRAAAKLLRAYIAKMARKLGSYRMTDGKSATRRSLDELRALADDYERMSTSKLTEVADLSIAVDRTGEDLTEYQDD